MATDLYEKSRAKIKDATKFKNTDIQKSILLIKEAIKICPEKILDDYFKLATYYYMANDKDNAFHIHGTLLNSLKRDNIFMFNRDRSTVFDKSCVLAYKEKNYVKYLEYYCLWIYNNIVASACQGQDYCLQTIDDTNKLNYLSPTKISSCFKKLKKEEIKDQFEGGLHDYIMGIRPNIVEMLTISNHKNFDKTTMDMAERGKNMSGISIGQRYSMILLKNIKFMDNYNLLNSGRFEAYYKINLEPLITT